MKSTQLFGQPPAAPIASADAMNGCYCSASMIVNEYEWRLRTKASVGKCLSIISEASAQQRMRTGGLNEVTWSSCMILARTLRRNHHAASALCMQQAGMALI